MAAINQIQLRRGTATSWETSNPTLTSGEAGFVTDLNRLKIGDGSTPWNDLEYISSESYSLVTTVFNNTGSTIPKMTAVYINGGQGDQPTVTLAQANTEATSSKTYGVTAEAISHMTTGKVVVIGALIDVNTDQFNPTAPSGNVNGTTLWLSPTVAGGLTTTKPSAPNHMVSIGTIIRTHQNEGIIEVKIQNGFELEELHNVAIAGVVGGQFLYYDGSTSLWKHNPNIYSSGSNIGIGTSSPGSTLDIRGSAVFNEAGGNFDFRIEGDTDPNLFFVDASADSIGIGLGAPTTKLQINGTFSCSTTGGDPMFGGQGILIDPTVPSLTLYDSNPVTVSTIDSNGLTLHDLAGTAFFYTDRANSSIGIGTSSPGSPLTLAIAGAQGTIGGASQTQIFQVNDASGDDYVNLAHFNCESDASRGSFMLSNNGTGGAWHDNVMQMFVHGTNYAHGYYGSNSSDAGCAMIVTQGSDIIKLQIGNYGSAPIEFFTDNTFRAIIDTSGNMGIGTATPTAKLDVNGNVNIEGSLSLYNNVTLSDSTLISIINSNNIHMWSNYV